MSLQYLKYLLNQWSFCSKATTLEGAFAPAWLGFGNAYAAQDESDQAMAAYRTAARLFAGYCSPSLTIWYFVFLGFYIVLHSINTKYNFPAFTLCTTGWLHCLDVFLVMLLHAYTILQWFAAAIYQLCALEWSICGPIIWTLLSKWVHILLFPILIAWNSLKAGYLTSVAFVVRMRFLFIFCRLINMCGLLQFFVQAKSICPTDPLVFNELGVMAYRNKQ